MSLTALDAAVSKVILLQTFNVVGGLCIIPLNIYFDLISGLIQTFVFVLLTMIYWKLESKTE
jgi:F0F1-type ATP synthase membrane subunit a